MFKANKLICLLVSLYLSFTCGFACVLWQLTSLFHSLLSSSGCFGTMQFSTRNSKTPYRYGPFSRFRVTKTCFKWYGERKQWHSPSGELQEPWICDKIAGVKNPFETWCLRTYSLEPHECSSRALKRHISLCNTHKQMRQTNINCMASVVNAAQLV